jgi:hypothetical protein
MKTRNVEKWIRRSSLLVSLLAFSLPALGVPPVVRTIPWVANQPLIPHDTWSGKLVTVKGTCNVQGAPNQYFWDFGDGSPVATGTVGNQYVIEAKHAYTGPVGLVFTATLTVKNTTTGEQGEAKYYVKIEDKTLPVEVNFAIDEGLWYLWKNAGRGSGQYWWNNIQYGNHYGNSTASAVQAFASQGHLENQPWNPYSEAVTGGIDYLTANLQRQAMSLQEGGVNPDSNSNGSGLFWPSDHPIYETGAVIDALVATGTPAATARTGDATYVKGKTYQTIVQDMVDMYAWGQGDPPYWYVGGWRYGWNSDADNSASQWAAIGMIAAERHFGCTVPQWVKDRNLQYLNYSYNGTGYFGYQGPGANRWYSTGPCGMVQLSFDGKDVTDPKWAACQTFIANNWNSFITWQDARYYSWYAFAKAMRVALPHPVVTLPGGKDWYNDNVDGLARLLVNSQQADGYWPYDGWPFVGYQTATAWNLLILNPTLFKAGSPVAVAKANPNPAIAGQTIQLDGSASYQQDSAKLIDSWEWDLDNDGTYDMSGPFATVSFPTVGSYPVKLRVTDNATPEESAVTTLTIVVNIPPLAPTAVAGGPYNLCPGTTPWFLNGAGSVNPDDGQHEPGSFPGDSIKSYAWDLDGDGQFDDAVGAQPDVTAFFVAKGVGSYLIQLKVTDNTAASFPSSGFGDLSGTTSTVVNVLVPSDPVCSCVSDLVARAKPGKVQLVWTHTGAHHYNVYRGTVSGGPYLKIASTTSTYCTYLDHTVVNGMTYYYVVREANLINTEECQSNQASARPKIR